MPKMPENVKMNASTETQTEIARLRDELRRGTRIIALSGLTSISAKSYVLSNLQAEINKTLVIITDSNRELETWENDLEFFNSKFQIPNSKLDEQSGIRNLESGILTLPSFEIDIYSAISPHAETLERRALALWNLSKNQPDFVLTSAKSLITKILSPKEMRKLGAALKRDEDFPLENLIEKLTASGYVREEPLKNVGEFSVRGGIVDVWSPDAENPVRLEFFGDTIDSIREFDAETQLSIRQLKEISIAPMREFAATPQDFKDWAFFAKERFADERFARNLKDRTQFAEEGETFNGWEFLLSLTNPRTSSLFDYLENCVLVIDEPTTIELHLGEFYENLSRRYAEICQVDEIGLEPDELFLSVEELRKNLDANRRIELRSLGLSASETDEDFTL
jgi:transcription-repair coupling factor (superfamily II helicase)